MKAVLKLGDMNFLGIDDIVMKSDKEAKIRVLDELFRNVSFADDLHVKRGIYQEDLKSISINSGVLLGRVFKIVEDFLMGIKNINDFYNKHPMSWNNNSIRLRRKIRIHLHKLHRIAPVFDYQRAKKNLIILHEALKRRLFCPQISTRLAIVIYVTDKKECDEDSKKYLIQKNVRALCNCSAYAFHRTRNKLGIK